MGKIGLFGLFMVCVSAIVVALIMTGPRATYWRGVLGPTVPMSATNTTWTGPDGVRHTYTRGGRDVPAGLSHRTTVRATFEQRFEVDRSQIIVVLNEEGETPDEVIRRLGEQRDRFRQAVTNAGFEAYSLNEANLETRPAPRRRADSAAHAGTMRLIATFDENVDFLGLLARPDFAEIGTIEKALYWLSDIDAAIAEVETEAARRARAKVPGIAGDRDWTEVRVQYTDAVKDRSAKYRHRRLRLSVTATVHIAIEEPGPVREN